MTADVIDRIMAATSPDELFGTDDPGREFRRLARLVHPDVAGPSATAAFARLAALWHDRDDPPRAEKWSGDLANLYEVHNGLLKLVRDPSCNDLIEREALALRALADRGDPRYLPYVPRLVETYRHRDARGVLRRGNVIAVSATGLHSLAEVAARRPDGLDPRDAAWMWRRLLVALGLAHRAGRVHGAVVGEHVLIQPDEHGVVLVDWCYSAGRGERVPAIVPRHRDRYPAEVLDRGEVGPGTDLAMTAGLMLDLMAGKTPKPLRAFADGCRQTHLRHRPDDAWRLLAELDELLERLYGRRTFRPFTL
jgi:hypothetical protein